MIQQSYNTPFDSPSVASYRSVIIQVCLQGFPPQSIVGDTDLPAQQHALEMRRAELQLHDENIDTVR